MYLSKRKGTYYIFYKKPNGSKTCKSTKTSKKAEAYLYLTKFEQMLKEKQENPSPTLKEYYKIYLDRMEGVLKASSWNITRNSFDQFVKEFGEGTKLSEITTAQCETYLLKKYRNTKYGTHLIYRNMKAAFNKAVMWDLIKANPFQRIKLPKIETNFPAYITEEQLQLLLEKETNPVLKANFAIAFYTGMRLSESLNLKWKDIDAVNKIIYIRNTEHHTTKSKKERIVPFGSKVEFYLSSLNKKSENDFVFLNQAEAKFNWNKVSKLFKNKVRESGLEGSIHYHSLRHSFASALVSKGIAIYTVQKLLGHSSPSMTAVYSHLNSQNLVDAVKVFD